MIRVGCLILDCENIVEESYLTQLTKEYSVKSLYTYNTSLYKKYCENHKIDLIEVSSHRDYLKFRKYFYNQLENCFVEENKNTQSIFNFCKYALLFENEIIYHKIWLITQVKKKDDLDIIFFSDKSDLSKQERQTLLPCDIIKIFSKDPRPAFKSDTIEFFREKIRILRLFKHKKPITTNPRKTIFFIEHYDKNLSVGNFFKKNQDRYNNKIAIIQVNPNSFNNSDDLNFFSPGIICYLKSVIESYLWYLIIWLNLKFKTFDNNQALKKSILNSIRLNLFDIIYFKRYAYLLIKRTNMTLAASTTYSSIFSRVFSDVCNERNIDTVYMQHGLLECVEYMMDFKQKIINLWGMIYFPYLKDKETKRIILGNVLDYSKNINKTEISLNNLKNQYPINIKKILFFPSRTGGNLVSIADNIYMFNILYESIKSLNKKQKQFKYHLTIKLHPMDSNSSNAFNQNDNFLTITSEYDTKYWISKSDICIAANSTAGTEICYYLKPFIFFTTSKTLSIIQSYEIYNVGIGVDSLSDMEMALTNIEIKHNSSLIKNMKRFNNDFAQHFEMEKFEELLSK
jgi:hypothetical protein